MGRNILDTIGNTPMVEIRTLNPNPKVRILAKMEMFNPGGSIKDRPALRMIEAGEESGELTKDKIVLEATSGNTGIGLALVCAVKGYRLTLAMSEAASQERQKILQARGAQILLTPGHLGTDGAIEEVYRLAREHKDQYFMTDQFNNPANWEAHYLGTGPEIWEQTGGKIRALVATLGTSGTLMGISRYLKEKNPDIKIIGVEPYLGHKIQGLKNMKEAYTPEIFEKVRLDEKPNVDDDEAYEMARRLAREEGLFVGMSSGAAMVLAVKTAMKMDEGDLVVVFPDSGERYLSTSLFAVKETVDMSLHNTMTREKEPFTPLSSGKVSMYSCGPTAYARMDLGECRRVVFADLISRYLTFRGYEVTHVMNITDLDDKTIAGSESAGMELPAFTQKYVDAFKQDIDRLGVRLADEYPRASENVDDMVAMARKLMDKGFAYEKLRSLYFDISRLPEYGNLSGIDLNKIRLGATVDLDEYEKDNPRDFTLFKRSRLAELKRGIYTKTEWGNVRPSWHIQCATMSMKTLGESFDIHASSRNLVFPHHENEMAIARALTGKDLAKYWLLCERVLVDGKNPGSGEERVTLEDALVQGYSAREIRYWLLSTHYSKVLAYSKARLDTARSALLRLDRFVQALVATHGNTSYPEIDQFVYDLKQGFVSAMDDDLSITAAMASVFSMVRKGNRLLAQGSIDSDGAAKILDTLKGINQVINVLDFSSHDEDEKVRALILEREQARKEKNWQKADAIRDQLQKMGVDVRDTKK